MKFKELRLFTHALAAELKFYSETLGFEIIERNATSFKVTIGWSILSFEESEQAHSYHYCFLIPCNKLQEALQWLESRTEIINIERGGKIQNFDTWNADSFYFFDASGNVVEFIARHDLENAFSGEFDISQVLGINEIGMPTTDVKEINDQLTTELQTEFWKGDLLRFGTNGSQQGLFLLPNYHHKELWFPSSVKIKPEPFDAIVESNGSYYFIEFRDEKLRITREI